MSDGTPWWVTAAPQLATAAALVSGIALKLTASLLPPKGYHWRWLDRFISKHDESDDQEADNDPQT